MDSLTIFLISIVILASFCGWGSFILNKLMVRTDDASSIMFGLGVFLLYASTLSLIGVCWQLPLQIFVASGLLLLLVNKKLLCLSGWLLFNIVIIGAVTIWIGDTPFTNPNDDARKYLPQVYYLASNGSLLGNPLSSTGYESLGGFTYIKLLYYPYVDLQHLVNIDFVLGMGIIMIWINCRIPNKHKWASPLLIILLLMTPMMVVNGTPLYLIIAQLLVIFSAIELTNKEKLILFPIFFVNLINFKIVFTLYIVILCTLLIIFNYKNFLYLVRVGIWTCLILVLWLPLVYPHLVGTNSNEIEMKITSDYHFLSPTPHPHGGNPLFYTILMGIPLFLYLYHRPKNLLVLIFSVMVFFVLMLHDPALSYFGILYSIRFLVPVILALLVLSIVQLLPNRPLIFNAIICVLISLNFLFASHRSYLKFLFTHRSFYQLNIGQEEIGKAYNQVIFSNEYSEYITLFLGLIPKGSKLAVLSSNTAAITSTYQKVYPIEFTSMIAPGFNLSGMDYLLIEDVTKQVSHHLELRESEDLLSNRMSQGFVKQIMPHLNKPLITKTPMFTLYKLR